MKKLFVLILCLFTLPLMVFADVKPKVLTLEASVNGSNVTFNGTTEAGVTAVMCKLIDAGDKDANMLSVEVNNNAYTGTIKAPATGTYTLRCANYDGGETKEQTVSTTITSATYTVHFNTNGGGNIDDVTVTSGEKVSEPERPTREGHNFLGWFEDETLNISFDFNKAITDNTTIYAKWTGDPVVVHTIFFGEGGSYIVDFNVDTGDGQGPLSAEISESAMYMVPAGEQMSLTAVPSEGWTFKGWYKGNVDAQTPEEWVTDELLESRTGYMFTPSGYPYIVPVFEDHREFRISFDTSGGDEIADVTIKSGELLIEPEAPGRRGYDFKGWFVDATYTTPYDFNTPVDSEFTLYAKWDKKPMYEYEVPDGFDNSITFEDEEEGHEFVLSLIDIMTLDDEMLEEFDITREEYEEILDMLNESLSEYGTLLTFYDIQVFDEDGEGRYDGPFVLKIKMTPEMEKYNSFKMLYVDVDAGFVVKDVLDCDVVDGYLIIELEHLSNYAIVGNTVETNNNTSNNPQTLDNIYMWIITLLVSVIGLLTVTRKAKKLSK